MKRVSLILFIYYINYFFSFFCSLIAEFLLPPSKILPRIYRDLSSIMKEIGMNYEAIHACLNDHVIYNNQHEFAIECDISRYRTYQVTKKLPRKVLRYIPIIPCLQRLFRFKNRSQDDVIRMPADGTDFRDIQEKWPHFKEEPRNLRISLAADGVNPFA